MADYNLNCVAFFKEKSIVYYIGKNRLHLRYVFINIPYSRVKSTKVSHLNVIWQSYNHYVTLCYTNHKSSLFHTGLDIAMALLFLLVPNTLKIKYSKVKSKFYKACIKCVALKMAV